MLCLWSVFSNCLTVYVFFIIRLWDTSIQVRSQDHPEPLSYHSQLTQSEVDSYVDSIPPSCQLDLHLKRTEQPYEGLSHQVKIVGIQGISTITIARDIDPGKKICIGQPLHLLPNVHKKRGLNYVNSETGRNLLPVLKIVIRNCISAHRHNQST